MDDRFLAEQLKRIRQMSEQMSEARRRLEQGSTYRDTDRQVPEDPFQAIRDYRPYESHDYGYGSKQNSVRRGHPTGHPPKRRRHR
jgi:hypothetical protein